MYNIFCNLFIHSYSFGYSVAYSFVFVLQNHSRVKNIGLKWRLRRVMIVSLSKIEKSGQYETGTITEADQFPHTSL